MMRRVQSSVLTAASVSAAARNIIVYSEQNASLATAAAAMKWSNVWVEDRDLDFLKYTLLPGQTPTSVRVPKQLELLNLDICEGAVPSLPPAEEHASLATQKPYGRTTAFELQTRAQLNGWQSKYWVTPSAARKAGMTKKFGTKSSLLIIQADAKLFNASQLTVPDACIKAPLSGATKRGFGSELTALLSAAITANGFKTGLFYTEAQLRELGLELSPDAVGTDAPLSLRDNQKRTFTVYNLTQIEGGDALAASLGRVGAPQDETFLYSGNTVRNTDVVEKMRAAAKTSRYWVTGNEVHTHSLKVLGNAQALELGSSAQAAGARTYKMYNADQVIPSENAFKMAGTMCR